MAPAAPLFDPFNLSQKSARTSLCQKRIWKLVETCNQDTYTINGTYKQRNVMTNLPHMIVYSWIMHIFTIYFLAIKLVSKVGKLCIWYIWIFECNFSQPKKICSKSCLEYQTWLKYIISGTVLSAEAEMKRKLSQNHNFLIFFMYLGLISFAASLAPLQINIGQSNVKVTHDFSKESPPLFIARTE